MEWNNVKKSVLHSMSDLVGKVDRKARKPIITQLAISNMNKRRRRNNDKKKERGTTKD